MRELLRPSEVAGECLEVRSEDRDSGGICYEGDSFSVDCSEVGQTSQVEEVTRRMSIAPCGCFHGDECGPGRHGESRGWRVGVALDDLPSLRRSVGHAR